MNTKQISIGSYTRVAPGATEEDILQAKREVMTELANAIIKKGHFIIKEDPNVSGGKTVGLKMDVWVEDPYKGERRGFIEGAIVYSVEHGPLRVGRVTKEAGKPERALLEPLSEKDWCLMGCTEKSIGDTLFYTEEDMQAAKREGWPISVPVEEGKVHRVD